MSKAQSWIHSAQVTAFILAAFFVEGCDGDSTPDHKSSSTFPVVIKAYEGFDELIANTNLDDLKEGFYTRDISEADSFAKSWSPEAELIEVSTAANIRKDDVTWYLAGLYVYKRADALLIVLAGDQRVLASRIIANPKAEWLAITPFPPAIYSQATKYVPTEGVTRYLLHSDKGYVFVFGPMMTLVDHSVTATGSFSVLPVINGRVREDLMEYRFLSTSKDIEKWQVRSLLTEVCGLTFESYVPTNQQIMTTDGKELKGQLVIESEVRRNRHFELVPHYTLGTQSQAMILDNEGHVESRGIVRAAITNGLARLEYYPNGIGYWVNPSNSPILRDNFSK
ncbi:MAG: hypothetical protein R3C45_01425 [Phycisphaerales bacterium]